MTPKCTYNRPRQRSVCHKPDSSPMTILSRQPSPMTAQVGGLIDQARGLIIERKDLEVQEVIAKVWPMTIYIV